MRPADAGHPAGFTLIEIMIVLLILGLVAGLVLSRGPQRSAALEMQQAAGSVADAFRLARTRAIATSRVVPVRIGVDGASVQLGDDAAHRFPAGVRWAQGARSVLFRPDGSASGGAIELTSPSQRRTVEVNWMTGRVAMR